MSERRNAEEEELRRVEPFWEAQLALLAALVLGLVLPSDFHLLPRYLTAILEALLLGGLALSTPYRKGAGRAARRRAASMVLIALISASNAIALVRLLSLLLHGTTMNGTTLLLSAAGIWVTNTIVFSLWFWELDRGGPGVRMLPSAQRGRPDFLFPQMGVPPEVAPASWMPGYVDYLYVAVTNSTAFSPTDVLPLTPRAKLLMGLHSLASFATVGLAFARAVNILR
jgi:hypothetical protein